MPNTANKGTKKIIVGAILAAIAVVASFFFGSCKKESFLFSCSLTDGSICASSELSFDARAFFGDKECLLTVMLGGEEVLRDENGKYGCTLSPGDNVIAFLARVGNREESRTYAIRYVPKNFVISTDVDQRRIVNGRLCFGARAVCDGSVCALVVLQNGKKLEEKSDGFVCELSEGNNKLELIASCDSVVYKETKNVYLGKFRLNTDLKDGETDEKSMSFRALATYDDEFCAVEAAVNGEKISDIGGRFDYEFPESGEYEFSITATTEKAEYRVLYSLSYCDEPPYFDILTLTDGKVCKGEYYSFDVSAKNGLGKKLPGSAIAFSVDFDGDDGSDDFLPVDGGEILPVWSDSVKSSFRICFTAGRFRAAFGKKTIIRVTATYGEKSVSRDFAITYVGADPDGKTGEAIFSLEAFTVSCGYLIPPTSIDIYRGKNFVSYLVEAITGNGWTYEHTGSEEKGFYLSSIGGLELSGNAVDERLFEKMTADGLEIFQRSIPAREDGTYSLGEFDFASGSGWMYSVNGVFPNYGFADYYPQDGDVVRVQFTLCLGKDVGGSASVGNESDDYFRASSAYEKLTALAADIARNDFYGRESEALDRVLESAGRWGVDGKTIEGYIARLEEYYHANGSGESE